MNDVVLPPNEAQRVATLLSLGVLNGQSEERFDRITRVLAALFDVPIAMVNMITSDEDINKSCFGIEQGGRNDRRISFCSHTILSTEPFIIENALEDPRFKDNPQVTGGLKVRAYAGVPLQASDGTHPGALCLIDTKPRKFTQQEIDQLIDLSAWAEIELNSSQLREALDSLKRAQAETAVELKKVQELNQMMVDRELKMIELKKEVAYLKEQLTNTRSTN